MTGLLLGLRRWKNPPSSVMKQPSSAAVLCSSICFMRYLISPCTVYTGTDVLPHHAVLVNGDRIEALLPAVGAPTDLPRRDGRHLHLCPGFVDVQVYGGGGVLFSVEPTADALTRLGAHLRRQGTTSFVPTMPTNSPGMMVDALAAVRQAQATVPGLLGLHLEGPYINPGKKGAHQAEFIQVPTVAGVEKLLAEAQGALRLLTLAPERVPPEVAQRLRLAGVVLSAGHSLATYDQATAAFGSHYLAATHLFNAMSGFESRAPGLVGAIYDHPTALASIIADGVHCDYAALRISQRLLGERLFLITDAVEASTQGAYRFRREGDHFVDEQGTLAGSALTMPQALANCVRHAGIPFE
ncbi:MAG: N-acetylglucosamine-6-phosphate deacetylase, partial [Cytophagaceae bacterium]